MQNYTPMIEKLYNEIGEWSKDVFADADSIDHIKKMIIEGEEVINDPDDIYEYADCLISLFAAAYKRNFDFHHLIYVTHNKLKINKKREYIKLDNGTYQHKE